MPRKEISPPDACDVSCAKLKRRRRTEKRKGPLAPNFRPFGFCRRKGTLIASLECLFTLQMLVTVSLKQTGSTWPRVQGPEIAIGILVPPPLGLAAYGISFCKQAPTIHLAMRCAYQHFLEEEDDDDDDGDSFCHILCTLSRIKVDASTSHKPFPRSCPHSSFLHHFVDSFPFAVQ